MKAFITALTITLTACSVCAKEYHVSTTGDDGNAGSKGKPFKTISAAAKVAQPGDVVTVHEGLYRERVNPPRGGTSDKNRIVYQGAPGEKVVIKGSEIVKGWKKVAGDTWNVTLPNKLFGDFNPYNDIIKGEWHSHRGYPRNTGTVYLNGVWMDEAKTLQQILPPKKRPVDPGFDSKDKVLGGRSAGYAGKAVEGTKDDILYQTCRYNLKGYRLAVPNGSYSVTLKFCEPHFNAKGKRVCDVKLQGKTVLAQFDIFAKVGGFAAHDESFDGVKVTDGQLKIDIINRVSMACISGIVIEQGNYSKRINCGGPKWKGYQRGPAPSGDRVGSPIISDKPFWKAEVDKKNTMIWAQFKDVDPNKELVEINVRQSIFYPDKPGRSYITVRGFTMRQAATPWSGAMSEQIGLIGTHWSKGWIIENNVISHSMNSGITLGRYDLGKFGIALPAVSAPGFVQSCELATKHGWSKENIGGHVVRNNHISHCEKNGIHGSLGGIFSTIEGNTIVDIAKRGWIGGPDVAGLKLLGSNDVIIKNNHIYRCGGVGGLWLDWMAQGTRVTGNLLHDNSQDVFMEVDHGPFLIDNNMFLSPRSLREWSQGAAYVHNLIAGSTSQRKERRKTPYFKSHTMKDMKTSDIQHKDQRYYNNVFLGGGGLSIYGEKDTNVQAAGNVYLGGAKPSSSDRNALVVADFKPGIKLEEKPDGWWLEMTVDPAWISKQKRTVVTTELLGKAKIPNAPFEQRDGTAYKLDTDYSGKKRNAKNPAPGPFEFTNQKTIRLKVWARK
jgi:alpha-L-arabinofuranosidase